MRVITMLFKKLKPIVKLVSISLLVITLINVFYQLSMMTVDAVDNSSEIKYLSKSEAEKMVKDTRNTLLIDVRNRAEYLQYHLEYAINIPMADLNEHLKELESYKEKNIIIYCQKGNRSKQVAQQLRALGYKRLYVIASGLE